MLITAGGCWYISKCLGKNTIGDSTQQLFFVAARQLPFSFGYFGSPKTSNATGGLDPQTSS